MRYAPEQIHQGGSSDAERRALRVPLSRRHRGCDQLYATGFGGLRTMWRAAACEASRLAQALSFTTRAMWAAARPSTSPMKRLRLRRSKARSIGSACNGTVRRTPTNRLIPCFPMAIIRSAWRSMCPVRVASAQSCRSTSSPKRSGPQHARLETTFTEAAINVPDPASCNTCSCNAGEVNGCTEIACPVDCPDDMQNGTDCALCGPTDACDIVRTGCLWTCTEQAELRRQGRFLFRWSLQKPLRLTAG